MTRTHGEQLPAGAPSWRKWHQDPGTRSRRITIKGAPTRKVPSSCFHFLQSMFLVRDQQIRDQMQARSSPRPWTGGGASRGRLRQLPCNCATHRRNEGLPTSSPASLAKRVCSRCTGTRPCFSISVGARVGSGGEHETRGHLIRCSSTYTTRPDSLLLTLHSKGRTSYEAATT